MCVDSRCCAGGLCKMAACADSALGFLFAALRFWYRWILAAQIVLSGKLHRFSQKPAKFSHPHAKQTLSRKAAVAVAAAAAAGAAALAAHAAHAASSSAAIAASASSSAAARRARIRAAPLACRARQESSMDGRWRERAHRARHHRRRRCRRRRHVQGRRRRCHRLRLPAVSAVCCKPARDDGGSAMEVAPTDLERPAAPPTTTASVPPGLGYEVPPAPPPVPPLPTASPPPTEPPSNGRPSDYGALRTGLFPTPPSSPRRDLSPEASPSSTLPSAPPSPLPSPPLPVARLAPDGTPSRRRAHRRGRGGSWGKLRRGVFLSCVPGS